MTNSGDARRGRVELFSPEGLNQNPAFSNVAVVSGPVRTIYVGGQDAVTADGEIVGKGDMAAQIRQVFENIKTALAAAGATMADIVKRQTFTTDIDAYFENIEARMEHGGDNLSTSTTVEVRRLSHPDFLIEVEVMAVLPQP